MDPPVLRSAAMWTSSEDARSDVILAAAAVFLGVQAVALIAALPFYPSPGNPLGLVLGLAWVVLLSCGAPYALARYRDDVPAAFALDAPTRGALVPGLIVAAPLVVGHVLASTLDTGFGDVLPALAGRLLPPTPALGGLAWTFGSIVFLVGVVALALGSLLTGTFLAVRSTNAFRSPDMDLAGLLRTFGVGGAGATLVLGLLVLVRDGDGNVLLRATAVLLVVLLADQFTPASRSVPRAAVVAPAVVTLVLWVIAFGGPLRGDLLAGLYSGVAAGTVLVAASALVHSRQGLAAAVLLVAATIWPVGSGYGMQPLPLQPIIG